LSNSETEPDKYKLVIGNSWEEVYYFTSMLFNIFFNSYILFRI